MSVTFLVVALVAFTPATGLHGAPVPWGGGGPDSFGYRYLDSDTTCPGAPVFNWVDIKGSGTEITSLGDDNYAGPFPLGFEFPYYWYKVHNVFVGSNGYITFERGGLQGAPMNPIPDPQSPNNTVAPLMADLTCDSMSPNGSVWYKATPDSFIVEWDSITFWSTGGNNSFQIIISRPDSSITFQYKEQSGAPYNGWAPTSNQTGIEDASGAIGLNYLSGTIPPGNMYHESLAVKFFPPDSTSLQVHDAGVRNAMNDRNGGMFVPNNILMGFWVVTENFGNQAEAPFTTCFKVMRQNNAVVFSDSMTGSALNPGQTDSMVLPSMWRPTQTGTYVIKIFTRMPGDMLSVNDTATIELHVVTMPANLAYDGGSAGSYQNWPGFGNRFVPPCYPCSVSSCKMNMMATAATDCYIGILDDDGPNGGPGTCLFLDTVSVVAANWYTVNLPAPVVITDGAFFVCGTAPVSSQLGFGMDSIPPLSLQGWEYTGVWAPSRDMSTYDACANATVSGPVGIAEWMQPAAPPAPVKLNVSPNPLGTQATIRLLHPRGTETAVELYDATGSVVRTLGLKRGSATLDGRLLADGIYFARVTGATLPVAKVIVAH